MLERIMVMHKSFLIFFIAFVFYRYDEAISAKSNVHATMPKSKGSSQNVIVQ